MNRPFKGQIDWIPDFIGEELMKQQERQGNERDITVFERNIESCQVGGGFDWIESVQGFAFWQDVLIERDINLFLAWFTPELEVWDSEVISKTTKKTIGYMEEGTIFPFVASDDRYSHAQLPKKELTDKEKLLKKADELLKKADELLKKADELREVAEKL